MNEDYLLKLMENGIRADKRQLMDYRNVVVQHNPFQKPEGSALVKIGETMVLVGIKMGVGEPFPDSPDEGVLMVSAEFSPVASSEFETGPPRENAIELARVVDRGIRESGAVDFSKLCITPKEKVWMVYVDIHILNHAGNLIDASSIGAAAAISSALIPGYDGEKVDYEKREKKLPAKFRPIAVSFAKVGGKIIIDPSIDEEGIMDGGITITTRDDGNICSIQKRGDVGFLREEVDNLIKVAQEKGRELRKAAEKSEKLLKVA